MRGDKPSYRARRALNRLSRDRWISGDECRRILLGWVGNNSAYRAAIAGCEYVGIIGGMPPAFIFDANYKYVWTAVNSGKSDTEIMIRLLTIMDKERWSK